MTAVDWSLAASWPVSWPTADDQAIFPKSNTNANIIDSLTRADGIDLSLLATMPGFLGNLGSSGTPIEGATARLHIAGQGNVYFNCAADASAQDVNEARIEPGNPSAIIELGSQNGNEGEYDLINILSGIVTLKGGIAFLSTGKVSLSAGRLITEASSSLISTVHQGGGVSQLAGPVTDLMLMGGSCTKESNKATNIYIGSGTTCVYNHAAIAGDVVRVIVMPRGVFDMTQNGELKVIDEVIEYPGAKVLELPTLHTITNHIRLREVRSYDPTSGRS